jgi:large subunit ribosomal protein L29
MIEPKELRGESRARLVERLGELKKEQFNLRFQRATGQLESTSRVREVRRDIARVKTVLREKSQPAAG